MGPPGRRWEAAELAIGTAVHNEHRLDCQRQPRTLVRYLLAALPKREFHP